VVLKHYGFMVQDSCGVADRFLVVSFSCPAENDASGYMICSTKLCKL